MDMQTNDWTKTEFLYKLNQGGNGVQVERRNCEQQENKQGADEMTEENVGVGLFSFGSINLIRFCSKAWPL